MRRMKIALSCSAEGQNYYLRQRYIQVLVRFAAEAGREILPVILPLTEDEEIIRAYAQEFDGFLMTGGGDIHPEHYGEEKLPGCGEPEAGRDAFELSLLRQLRALKKPVFGICRGIQIMNVSCGGTLWQDMPTQYQQQHGGGQPHCIKDEHDLPRHFVTAGGWLAETAGAARFPTNSYHHQSIKVPGEHLIVCGRSEDGSVEAVIHDTLPFYRAVQWHPEVNPDGISKKLYEAFFEAVEASL